jgi:hypothetical protein
MKTRHIWVRFDANTGATNAKRNACTVWEDPNRPGDPAPLNSVHLTWTDSRTSTRVYQDFEKRFLRPAPPRAKKDDVIILKEGSPHVGQVFEVTRYEKRDGGVATVKINNWNETFHVRHEEVCKVSDSIDYQG